MSVSPSPLILLVDDTPEFREIFGTALRSGGYEVQTASGGIEAIAAAKRFSPALILMDVQMPGLTGIETLLRLKEDPATKNIKVVFLTNLGNEDTESMLVNDLAARDIHAEGYLKKTEDMNVILSEVKRYLAS